MKKIREPSVFRETEEHDWEAAGNETDLEKATDLLAVAMNPSALPDEIDVPLDVDGRSFVSIPVSVIRFKAVEDVKDLIVPACSPHFTRRYQYEKTDFRAVDRLLKNASVLAKDSLRNEGLPDSRQPERHVCIEESPIEAGRIERALSRSFSCSYIASETASAIDVSGLTGEPFSELCAALGTHHLCEYAASRESVRVGVAMALTRQSLNRLRLAIPKAEATTEEYWPKTIVRRQIESLPQDLVGPTQARLRRATDSIVAALIRAAREDGSGPSFLRVGVATMLLCEDSGFDADISRGGCPFESIASKLKNPPAARLARTLAGARTRSADADAMTANRFVQAVNAAATVLASDAAPQAEESTAFLRIAEDAADHLLAVFHATMSHDASALYAVALRQDVERQAAYRALAFASTRNLTIERATELGLLGGGGVNGSIAFGVGLRAVGGINFLNSGGRIGYAGPMAAPCGFTFQGFGLSRLYFDITAIDPGQYLTIEPRRNAKFRTPGGLDAFSPAISVGYFSRHSIPLVIALNGGLARVGARDMIGFGTLSVGTFFSLVSLRTPSDE